MFYSPLTLFGGHHDSPSAASFDASPLGWDSSRMTPVDGKPLSSDSPAHRATRLAPHVIERPTSGAGAMRSAGRGASRADPAAGMVLVTPPGATAARVQTLERSFQSTPPKT